MTFKELFSCKVFWIFMLLMFAAGASEQTVAQWASVFAEQGLGVSKAVGDLTGPMFFCSSNGGVPPGLWGIRRSDGLEKIYDWKQYSLRVFLSLHFLFGISLDGPRWLRYMRLFRGNYVAGKLQ